MPVAGVGEVLPHLYASVSFSISSAAPNAVHTTSELSLLFRALGADVLDARPGACSKESDTAQAASSRPEAAMLLPLSIGSPLLGLRACYNT